MSHRPLFLATLFFLLSPWCLLGLGNAPEKPEKDIYVSEQVKIAPQQGKEKKPPAQESAAKTEKQDTEKQEKPEAAKQPAQASEPGQGEARKALGEMMLNEQEALLGDQQPLYTRKGRVDPFEPFINREQAESENEEGRELQRRKPQTPLERIALSQLKLTAILQVADEKRAIAMVEDQTGKGYIVYKGTYIGENGGRVIEILSDRIVIEEKYKDVFGKIAVREIEKKLQK